MWSCYNHSVIMLYHFFKKLDHWIMQFKSFQWLGHHGSMLYKYGQPTLEFWGLFTFILV